MDSGQGHDGNGDSCAGHVDRCAEGNRNGIRIGIDTDFFRQGQVDRDVSGRAARKEGRDTGRLDAFPDQRIRIAVDFGIDDNRIDDKGKEQHRP